jgi:hypothetical protein
MNHFATADFWYCYRQLPAAIQELADKNFALLRQNPHHSSLRLRKIDRFWRPALVCVIGLSPETEPKDWFGFGLARTTNTSDCSKDEHQ